MLDKFTTILYEVNRLCMRNAVKEKPEIKIDPNDTWLNQKIDSL